MFTGANITDVLVYPLSSETLVYTVNLGEKETGQHITGGYKKQISESNRSAVRNQIKSHSSIGGALMKWAVDFHF